MSNILAFPRPCVFSADGELMDAGEHGMSLRDYFIAHAEPFDKETSITYAAELVGIPAPTMPSATQAIPAREIGLWWLKAEATYKAMQADAMLAAREVKP